MFSNTHLSRMWFITFGIFALVLCGCAKKAVESTAPQEERIYLKAPPAPSARFSADSQTAAEEPAEMDAEGAEQNQPRMVHHNGYIHLRTPQPAKLADEAVKIVETSGGYVEQMDNHSAVFRVPVMQFKAVFKQLLALGDVLDQSITSEDITDAFMDVDLRLSIARATRKRLVALLGKAKSEKEKIRILREIQRISTQIETLNAQRDRLLSMSRYGRITLRIETRRLGQVDAGHEAIAAFEWIHQLSPFSEQIARSGKPLAFDVPKGMVVLDQKKLWVAESPDGAFMRASQHNRQPAGDTAFWLKAVGLRLSPGYGDTRTLEAGNFKLLRLEDRSETPYVYLIALHVTERQTLELVEIYYPTPDHEKRYNESILHSIGRGAR
jgi:hypothetical protein